MRLSGLISRLQAVADQQYRDIGPEADPLVLIGADDGSKVRITEITINMKPCLSGSLLVIQ